MESHDFENLDLLLNLIEKDQFDMNLNDTNNNQNQSSSLSFGRYNADSEEDLDIEIPAQNLADYQKKQYTAMQKRKSFVRKNSIVSTAPTTEPTRRGSIAQAARRFSNASSILNPINQDPMHRPKGSIVEGNTKHLSAKPSFIKAIPVIITEDVWEESSIGANSHASIEEKDMEHAYPKKENQLQTHNPRRTLTTMKSKRFLISAAMTLNENENEVSDAAIHTFDIAHQNSVHPLKENLLKSNSSKHTKKSIKKEEFTQETIKKNISGVLPMGYHELKQLYNYVSSITHKLRMHHDEKTLTKANLIVNEEDLKKSKSNVESSASITFSEGSGGNSTPEVNRSIVRNALFTSIETCTIPTNLSVSGLLQSHCTTKLKGILKENILNAWLKYLKKKHFTKLTTLLFWYFWHVLYRPFHQDIIDRLLKKISVDYVAIFIASKLPRKDHFFLKLPDFLSFAIVRIFQESFPLSPELLDQTFKTNICAKLCILLSGINPSFPPSETWEKQSAIEKLNIQTKATKSAEEAKQQKRKALMQILTSAKHLDDPVSLDEKIIDREFAEVEKQPDSSFYGDTRKGHFISFNLYDNSPLVSEYLQTTARHKQILIRRAEISKESPPPNLQTYRQIIEESKKLSKQRREEFRRNQERIQKERIISI